MKKTITTHPKGPGKTTAYRESGTYTDEAFERCIKKRMGHHVINIISTKINNFWKKWVKRMNLDENHKTP